MTTATKTLVSNLVTCPVCKGDGGGLVTSPACHECGGKGFLRYEDTYEGGNPYGRATTTLGALEQDLECAEQTEAEVGAEYRNEVAMFGDAWAGASLQMDRIREGVRMAKDALDAYLEVAEFERHMAIGE